MRVFKDNEGRDWTLDINLTVRKILKAKTGVDLLDVEQVQRLVVLGDIDDLDRLGEVLTALCQDQLDKKSLTVEQFATGLKGAAFDSARTALEEEIVDFFPPSRRSLLQKMLAKTKALHQAISDQFDQQMDSQEIERKVSEKMNSLLLSLLNGPSIKSPVLSESLTPDH